MKNLQVMFGVIGVAQEEGVHVAREPEVDAQAARRARLEHDLGVPRSHLIEHGVETLVVSEEAVARAMANRPRLLLADEPTGNLDSLMARQVMELLEQINQNGCTILMVTHDPDQARRAGRQVQIVDGQLSDAAMYDPLAVKRA
mgnify:CR=1 FL=1